MPEKRRMVGMVERRCVSKAFPIKITDKAIWQHCHMLGIPAARRAGQRRGPAGLKRPAGPARKSAAKMGGVKWISKIFPIKIPQK